MTAGKPIPALAELIWNACDADATHIDVEIEKGELGMQAVVVRDNGHGIPHDEIEQLFGKLGGSWKARGARSKTKLGILHGKEGKGRFKALALGRVADWTIVYKDADHRKYRYTLSLIRDDLVDVRVSEPIEADPHFPTGVEVRITELDRTYRSLDASLAVSSLAQIFALYLTEYPDLSISFEHERIDPQVLIAHRDVLSLSDIADADSIHSASVELIEWKMPCDRWIFLCGANGLPFQRSAPSFHAPGHQFTAYIKSSYIDELQERGLLDLAELNAALQRAYDEAVEAIKAHFKARDASAARSKIEQWKAEDVYPYRDEPTTPVDVAERQVFDIVALNVNKHLADFEGATRQTKAFQLRMLRQAIERGPDELQLILKEVLDLPPRKQQELAKLLEDADLGNIISASKLVADRLKFIHGLEALLFEAETRALLKERSQLHRILADNNTWVFGEQFSLTVDDQSLTEVLRKHHQMIGRETVIDAPVKRIDGKTGIVDLMLSRSVPQNRMDEREHLVVELKRPSVKVGAEEITQVEKYAYTIAKDERFRGLKTRWTFWVVSNDLDDFASVRTRQKDKPRGQVSQTEDGLIEVWVKTWSEIISECKARLRFVQDHLQANVDKDASLSYLKVTYDRYLSGIEVQEDNAA
ncbi:ATP-binding protein [Bradyrhizobium sp. 141]|uniref:ATP-binding protein n=1 Tax=Bradyrhizobium sp. 141 TaxID=2782617 RepID=UPI001FF8EEB5|nr:ATP-binding protein [Bradyrhizobium sp. 141]